MKHLLHTGCFLCVGLIWAELAHPGQGLRFEDCEQSLPGSEFRCAAYRTGDGHSLRVVIVLPDEAIEISESHPLLFLHGGPGYPFNLDAKGARYWRRWLQRLGRHQPVVLFDQRGAGQSRPAFDCPEYDGAALQVLGAAMPPQREYAIWREATARCRKRITASGFVATDFSSRKSAADAAGIMAALGAAQWDLLAVSYGTRVALRLIELAPPGLDAAALDSVLPVDRSPLDELPWLYGASLRRLFHSCRDAEACNRMQANPEQRLLGLLARLQADPVPISVPGPAGEPITVMVNDLRLVEALFHAMYSLEMIRELPANLEMAARGKSQALRPLIVNLSRWAFDVDLSDPVYYAVACRERNAESGQQRFRDGLRAYAEFAPWLRLADQYDLCKAWNYRPTTEAPGPVPATAWDKPILLLAGHFDPVTPVSWAQEVANGFTHAVVHEAPRDSHIVLESNTCVAGWVAGFFADHSSSAPPNCASGPSPMIFDVPDDLLSN